MLHCEIVGATHKVEERKCKKIKDYHVQDARILVQPKTICNSRSQVNPCPCFGVTLELI